jgi:hypothetical protein
MLGQYCYGKTYQFYVRRGLSPSFVLEDAGCAEGIVIVISP